jgi:PIN domain nuclease of toxin-antitoxin system
MKLLLDTHIWLWSLLDPKQLARKVTAEMRSPENELWLSPISAWEVMLLAERSRIEIDGAPAEWVERALRIAPMREAPLTYEVAVRSTQLKVASRDPADRFIAASAAVHGLTLVTADERLIKSRDYSVLANR